METTLMVCPACGKQGYAGDFCYLMNQQVRCNACGKILDTRAVCPACGRFVILKYPFWDKLNPFAALWKIYKIRNGSFKNQQMHCPKLFCLHKGRYADFGMALLWKGRFTIYRILA